MVKKAFFSLLLLWCGLRLVGAVETHSGDYVLYKDSTFTAPTWVGFLQYDNSRYASILYTPSEQRRICVLFSVEIQEGKMELTGQNLTTKVDLSNTADVEAVNYLMQLLPDLYHWGITSKEAASLGLKGKEKKFSNISYLSGDITVKCLPTIPLFGIESITSVTQKTKLLSLARIGTVIQDSEFFNLVLPHEKELAPTLIINPKAKKTPITVNGNKIALTEQWKKEDENFFLLENSGLLTISQIENQGNTLIKELTRLFCTSDYNRTVLLEKSAISGSEKKLTVTNEVYDTETQTVNFDKKYVIFSNNKYTIISLTVKKADYYANKGYFDSLF